MVAPPVALNRLRTLWRRWRHYRSPYIEPYDWQIEDPELGQPSATHVRLLGRWPK
jgi:hypothetical protein